MFKLGKGVALFLFFIEMLCVDNLALAMGFDELNWLPLFSTNMSQFQPDMACPKNRINGLHVRQQKKIITSTIESVDWDLDCPFSKTAKQTDFSLQQEVTQINTLLENLNHLPDINLHIKQINLTADFLKKKLSSTLLIESNSTKLSAKLISDLVQVDVDLDLVYDKFNIVINIDLDEFSDYFNLEFSKNINLNNQLAIYYHGDLSSWYQNDFSMSWKGEVVGFSEKIELSVIGNVNFVRNEVRIARGSLEGKQLNISLSEHQYWQAEYVKFNTLSPSIIHLSPLTIQDIAMQVSVSASHLVTEIERGKSKRIRVDKQKLPPLVLHLNADVNEHNLIADWSLALLEQNLSGQLALSSKRIKLQLQESRINLPILFESLADYIESLTLFEIENGELTVNLHSEYDFIDETLAFNSSLSSVDVSGKNGELLFEGVDLYSHLNYLIDRPLAIAPKKVTVVKDEQSIKIKNLFIGVPIQMLEIEGRLRQGMPLIDNFNADLLGGHISFEHFDLVAPSQTQVNLEAINLAEVIKYSAYPEIFLRGVVDANLPLTLSSVGVEINQGTLSSRIPGGVIKVPENTVIKAMGEKNPATAFTLQLLSDFHFDTLEGKIGYTDDGDSDIKVEIKGVSPMVSGSQPINFNYSHNENILKLLKTLRFNDELVREIKERY